MAVPVLLSDLFHLNIDPAALQGLAPIPSKLPAGQTLVTRIVSMSQTDYDNLSPKDPATLYVIPES